MSRPPLPEEFNSQKEPLDAGSFFPSGNSNSLPECVINEEIRDFVENEHYSSIWETVDAITEFQEVAMSEMQTIECNKATQHPEFMALRKRR